MWYRIGADLVLLLHLAFVLFVVTGALLLLKWPRLAWLHLPAAIWGAIVEYTGWICPLTPIEHTLRAMTGESAYSSDFIGHYLLPLMYPAGLTRPVQMLLGTAVVLVNVTTNRDTIIINNTSGDYYPLENKWIGKGGKVDWAKAGVSSATVYANVKGEYTLNLDNFIITIDTVEFFHKEYFPTALYGKYSDKFGTGDTASSTFPRFDSKDLKITIKDLAPNVSYLPVVSTFTAIVLSATEHLKRKPLLRFTRAIK